MGESNSFPTFSTFHANKWPREWIMKTKEWRLGNGDWNEEWNGDWRMEAGIEDG